MVRQIKERLVSMAVEGERKKSEGDKNSIKPESNVMLRRGEGVS